MQQPYKNRSAEELAKALTQAKEQYEVKKALGLKLNMSRGVPERRQLDISMGLFTCLSGPEDYMENGLETRNYGVLDGLPAAKALFAELLEVPPDQIIVGGNSSLNLMYDTVQRGMQFGFGGCLPWNKQSRVVFLCPVPGYDRHFTICERLGIEMRPIPMTPTGPDMDEVRRQVKDPAVKGIWCVPKYSNPDGVVYSDETVRAFATLQPAAADFRIFWDNAYCVHSLYEEDDVLLNLQAEAEKAGNPNLAFTFASTSKITFPGSGVACMAGGKEDIAYIVSLMQAQTIGPDKVNQLRHVRFFKNADAIRDHMKKHADIIRPKFEAVLERLESELAGLEIASWTKPKGGYFISLDVMPGTAKRVVALAAEAGVIMTPAGSTWPYKKDPNDSNIRIAPTFPTQEEIEKATDTLCACVKLATLEKLTSEK